MRTLEELTKDERSLLLYLETRLVDYRGMVDTRKMNKDDMDIAKGWHVETLIEFGRLPYEMAQKDGGGNTHYVSFSDLAWQLAHEIRRERARRGEEWLLKKVLAYADA